MAAVRAVGCVKKTQKTMRSLQCMQYVEWASPNHTHLLRVVVASKTSTLNFHTCSYSCVAKKSLNSKKFISKKSCNQTKIWRNARNGIVRTYSGPADL